MASGNKRIDSYDDLFEPFSPVNSPDHLFELSDEEMGSTKRVCPTSQSAMAARVDLFSCLFTVNHHSWRLRHWRVFRWRNNIWKRWIWRLCKLTWVATGGWVCCYEIGVFWSEHFSSCGCVCLYVYPGPRLLSIFRGFLADQQRELQPLPMWLCKAWSMLLPTSISLQCYTRVTSRILTVTHAVCKHYTVHYCY